jgi:hypothetical protein
MEKADIVPQSEDDVKFLRDHQKDCLELEGIIDSIFEAAKSGNADIKSVFNSLDALKIDTRAHRLADSWLTNQKQAAVQVQVERVAADFGLLFTGRTTRAGKSFCEIMPRLERAGKGKKTPDTYRDAVSAEADIIISEMEALSNQCNDNLIVIDAIGMPTLFPDIDALMLMPPEQLAAITARRVAEHNLQEEKKKVQIKRNPEKLAELKKEVCAINNIIHLENWWNKHEDEIKEALPHSDDIAVLLTFCGERRAELNIKLKEDRNDPPPPMHGDMHPESGPAHSQSEMVRQEERATMEGLLTSTQEEHADHEENLSFIFKVTIPGNSQASKDIANDLGGDLWGLIESRGCIAEEIKD